jgi:hypothetical protein
MDTNKDEVAVRETVERIEYTNTRQMVRETFTAAPPSTANHVRTIRRCRLYGQCEFDEFYTTTPVPPFHVELPR